MAKQKKDDSPVKPNEPPKKAETVTREVNTNPDKINLMDMLPKPPGRLVNVKILGDVLPLGYGCNIGETYPFPENVAYRLKDLKLGEIIK